ncbi:MAG: branched-chain amino acid ABC transporter permease, partial [Acholeplasmatales bacterium]
FFIVGGLLIIFVILFYPNGLVYLPTDLKKGYYKLKMKLNKKKVSKHEN